MKDSFGGFQVITGHEGTGCCFWCGSPFSPGRPRRYCSPGCSEAYLNHFFWPSASAWALKQAHHRCQRCGVSDEGMRSTRYVHLIARSWGVGQELAARRYYHRWPYDHVLEVHHKEALNGGYRTCTVLNAPWNLVVLCVECHNRERLSSAKRDAEKQLAFPIGR